MLTATLSAHGTSMYDQALERPISDRQHFRADEAAEYLRISLSKLNKLRCYGGGPVYHVAGRTIIYSRADLDAWLAQHRRTSTSDAGR